MVVLFKFASMSHDSFYMERCIELAKKGLGYSYPNPLVGCVIVFDGKIIGEGWHRRAGDAHAEVVAINSVRQQNLLAKSTLYVSLEPCCHFGKTPPCTDLITKKGIKKIVIGATDINPKVAGKGIKKMKNIGCEVIVDVLKKKCIDINKRFFTFYQKKRPYIILKWAQSQDGFIDILHTKKSRPSPFWITNTYSRLMTHKWRSQEQSILIGTNTALNDNPNLTVRDWKGLSPIRIVIDKNIKTPKNNNLWNGKSPTIFITEKKEISEIYNTTFEQANFLKSLPEQLCYIMHKNSIQSVIIEGGAKTLEGFIELGLWDEARVFVGQKKLYQGLKSPKISGLLVSRTDLCGDVLYVYHPN